MRRRLAGPSALAILVVSLATATSAMQLTIGAGSSLDLGTNEVRLGCGDLAVAGTLFVGIAGVSQARDFSIDPGGIVNAGLGKLEVAGDWSNAGTFNAGTSTVRLLDGCERSSAVVSGNTDFADLLILTGTGKLYRFASGSTQTVIGTLTMLGAPGNLLRIRSTGEAGVAFFDLRGLQSVDYVDVENNVVTGGNGELGPNSVKGPNTGGWSLAGAVVPGLGALGLTLLVLALVAGSRRILRRTTAPA